jgi:hypothetical protein
VALFVFNRPECTQRVFDAIAKARPARLLLTADGPRPGKPGDAEACRQVREIVSHVDWPCEVSTNFAESNLGCQERMISGMNWVFSLVEEAIILEDDCLPDPSFFPFCAELLEKYRGDARVAAITGTNLVEKYLKTDASYFFSQRGGNWGWATWRSAWQRFDRHLSDWPQLRREGFLLELFGDSKPTAYWTAVFDDMHANKGRNAWDYQWVYTNLKNNALTIVPRVNLITNIGFGPGATHTTGADSRFTPPAKAMKFPLKHPASFIPLRSLDRRLEELCSMKLRHRISGKVRNIARRLQQPKKASTQSGAY